MKGLLIKDIKLMVKQQRFFSSVLFVAVLLSAVVDNPSFIIGYMTFIGSMFTLSSISYDEFDNGNAFLFSLPITRRMYAAEKYGFGMMVGGGLWLFSTVLAAVVGEVKKTVPMGDTLMMAGIVFPMMLFMLALMLPFQLKFGGEKGRIASIIMIGGVFVLAIAAAKAAEWLNIDLEGMLNGLQRVDLGVAVAVVVVVSAAALLLSAKVSISIMEKKEF